MTDQFANREQGRSLFTKPLPAGFAYVKLGELCERLDYGFTASTDFTVNEPRFVRITDIQNGCVDWEKVPGCRISGEEEAAYRLADGDVLFARTGATTGKSFLIRQPPRAVFASYLIRLRLKSEVNPEFIYSFFQSGGYWEQIRARARGGAQPNVNATLLATISVPVPPLAEQKRIAGILKEQMAAVERARRSAEAQLQAAEALPAAYLRAVFNSPEAQQWPRKKLGDVAVLKRGRFTPRPRNDPRYFGGPYKWIQIGEVEAAQKYILEHRGTLNELGLSVSKMFPKGTLVISIAASIGAVGILGFDSCMPDSLVGIMPHVGLSDSEYLYYWLSFTREHLESIAPQMAQANLKLQMLNPLELPCPPLAEQQRIVAHHSVQMASAERLRQKLAEQLDAINRLPAALLRRAFRGEL